MNATADLCLTYRFHQPLVDEIGDFKIVFFDHQHMAVAADTHIFQPHEGGGYASLHQVLGGAVVVHRVIRRLCRENDDGNVLQMGEFAHWFALRIAAHEVGTVG